MGEVASNRGCHAQAGVKPARTCKTRSAGRARPKGCPTFSGRQRQASEPLDLQAAHHAFPWGLRIRRASFHQDRAWSAFNKEIDMPGLLYVILPDLGPGVFRGKNTTH